MYDRIRKIMHCISTCFVGEKGEPVRLRVEGATTTLTPEPDDAELAAEALLQSMEGGKNEKMKKSKNEKKKNSQPIKDKAYYEQLAKRMQEGHEMERRMATRFVAYCEQELKNPLLPIGRIVGLEHDLLQRQAIVDREGGELKKRWQRCLAEVTVRMMNSVHTETTESTEGANTDDTDGTDI